MKDFNIAKYLKENHLGPHAILGGYVDLHALKEDMDAVNALTDKWKNDPSTDPEGDWRNKPFDQARASAEDWFDEYEEEGRLDDFYGMSVEELIDALELFGEPDAKKVAPILHKMINSEADVEDLEGLEIVKGFGATKSKSVADQFAKTAMTAGMEGVKVVEKDGVFKIYAKGGGKLKEKKMASGKNSETITLSYYDYPSISDGDQRFAVKTFIKFVKSLGGDAKVVKDKFDDIDFKLTGISSEEVKKAYAKLLKALDKRSFLADPSPFDYLASWTVNPPGLDEYNQLGEKEEMYLDTKIPYEGPERKVDGFGDKYKQTNAVEEVDEPPFGMPDKSEENPWMDEVDGTAAYQFGNWTCYYDYPGVLAWSYKDIPLNKLAVYATPDWESDGTTPIQIDIDEETQDKMTLKQSEFADFNEYATAMKPYLDRIEDLESDFGSLAPVDEGMNDDDSENPFPSIMKQRGDNRMAGDDEIANMSHDDRFAYMGGSKIEKAIRSLMADNFKDKEIAQFVVDTIRKFKK